MTWRAFSRQAGSRGQTVVYLVADGQVAAAFALADVVRPESREAVRRLHEMGVEVAMLTGDSEEVAAAVAEELGIDRYFAEVLPEHKDQKVMELQRQGKRVAMVGDGVNDAPALTRADVGIAIGGGTDVAVESAGIILVKSNPLDVVKVINAEPRQLPQDGAEPGSGPPATTWSPCRWPPASWRPSGHPALAGGGRAADVAEHHHRGGNAQLLRRETLG